MLRMTAIEICYPVLLIVLMKADDSPCNTGAMSRVALHVFSKASVSQGQFTLTFGLLLIHV